MKGKEQNTWETLCRIITTMEGLRNIRIDILSRPTYDEEILRVLAPLKGVKISGRFEIHGPWSKHFRNTKPWEDEEVPFVLINYPKESFFQGLTLVPLGI